jgi:2-oxo-4-hydroxy-4-carboxy-5-ureidoimidazoline decarboxylase
MKNKIFITELNDYPLREFVKACAGFFEGSPWIAERAWHQRPFRDRNHLHQELMKIVLQAANDDQLGLLQAHPDLVGGLANQCALTNESRQEQTAAGLTQLTATEVSSFQDYNARYKAKFGFPFILCARENKAASILAAFPIRLQNSTDEEIQTALKEICKISRLRLEDRIEDDIVSRC